uniref:EF-hand domain-containing protein n=1 Tax=Pygocentrus nattereri TaxID=42514 RepID=A0A3B4DW92_PYGNA
MDGEGDQYEERLREVFQSFDGSGAGSLNPEELAELCHALQLNDTALHTLLHTLINSQDQLNARVEFEQFKNALILVLSSPTEEALANEENPTLPDSPEVQPRFIKGGKRYGRRSTPEFTHAISELSHMPPEEDEQEEEALGSTDGTLPSKRERWNADVSSAEEYEAEGQLHLWNPDEPGTPRGSMVPLSGLEERLQSACQQLALPLNGMATLHQLHALCQYIGMEVHGCMMSVQEFVSYILNKNKPPTPSASTPYRQLKRHHSIQPFDETGRRISSVLSSTIGLRLFSVLDDGTGHTAVEQLLDTWLEEGVENSSEILQALEFSLDGKVNLTELTAALENELLITKNSIHQAALVSFKAEIRHLLECVDLELREKEKIRSDLEKAEKLKSQLASEVDEHHSAIERINDLNLRKLEQEHKDHMVALRVEMSKEVELVQQQANQQREELEQEIRTIREDETFLRERLTLTIKENGRLEAELLDSTERLIEAEAQLSKLQRNLDSVLKEKFGDLDLSNAEFYQQEERLGQLRSNYEEQCRELQDRIDELQAQLEEYRAIGRTPQTSLMPSLSDELDSKSPGMESDQGLGSEEGQPFNMSLEAEMVLEQLKEQHVREMENIRAQKELEIHFSQRIKEVEARFSGDQEAVSERFQTDVRKLEQHYQSELAALTQRHAADHARWDEEMEASVQDAEQQRRLLREALQLERENVIQEFTLERERLEHSHAVDMEALREKNLQLQNELENFVTSAQTKEIELSRQLNELHNRLQENLETKDTLLAHAECKADELEQLLRQASDDFLQERAELQNNLSKLEGRHAETISLAEKRLREQSDLLAERVELRGKMEEMEKVLRQAVEDFHYERLELQGIVAALEEQLQDSVSMVMKKEEQRTVLLAERDRLALRVQQMESELGEATRAMIVSKQVVEELSVPDLPREVEIEFLALSAEKFVVKEACEDETADHHSEDFSVLGEDSPSAQDEELEGELSMQKENTGEFEDIPVVSDHMLILCSAEVLSLVSSEMVEFSRSVAEDKECFEVEEPAIESGDARLFESYDDHEVEVYNRPGDRLEEDKNSNANADWIVDNTEVSTVSVTELNSRTMFKDSVEMANELEVTSIICKTEEMTADDLCAARAIKDCANVTTSLDEDVINCASPAFMTSAVVKDPQDVEVADQFEVRSTETETSYHKDHRQDFEPMDQVDLKDDSNGTKAKDSTVALESRPTLKKEEEEETPHDKDVYAREILELQDIAVQFKDQSSLLEVLQDQYSNAVEQNLSLQEQLAQLQQHTNELELLLDLNRGKLEESHELRVELITMAAQAKELEIKELELAELQRSYEECVCENMHLADRNRKLEKRVQTLESKMHIVQEFHKQQTCLLEEIARMREENAKLSTAVQELEKQDEPILELQQDAESSDSSDESFLDFSAQLEAKVTAMSELEDCCSEFEKQNLRLRLALTQLQEKSFRIHERMQDHRYRKMAISLLKCVLKKLCCHLPLFQVQALDSTLQGLAQQNARLKSDLRITQQERDALKQEVISLHKQLQNANEKMSISSVPGGSQQGKRVWTELSGLMEAELTLLREENQRLQREINDARLEMNSAREKGRQLEALVLSVKQQKQQNQASLSKSAEQERSALKREIEALHTQLHNKEQREMESLQEENERLRNKQTILEAQLMEVFREAALLQMEGRMKEVEFTLRNVKLLLQEKVAQLKEQLHKNSKADVLIKDLYVENAHLLKALEMSEQRQKVAEKKNYLLEEKISSLNKIVRELNPSPLTPVPYHFTRT